MKPNLLFIFSDQHAARVTGCYGNDVVETPNLDRLAREGVTFDNAYCPSPLCVPSRMSMLTARYPHHTGVWGNEDILPAAMPTMAHALGAAGYRALLVGRLHALGPDQLVGYADRLIGEHHSNWPGIPREDMGPLMGAASPLRKALRNSGTGMSSFEVMDTDVAAATERALEEAARRIRSGETDRFAITMAMMLPHSPFVARKADFERYAGRVGLARRRGPANNDDHPWIAAWRRRCGIESVTQEEEIRTRTAYYGLVTAMDRLVGRALAALDRLGLADNTLVVYASDHGEQIGEHGLWWKHTFYEDSVRVPVILKWPGQLPAGQRRPHVVNLVDVTATILDALGAPRLENGDGVSFLDVARDPNAPWTNRTYSEYCAGSAFDFTIPGATTQNRMVRDGDYKLCYYHRMPAQLFDLRNDPDEEHDLADDPRYRQVRRHLTELVLHDWNPDEIERRIESNIADKKILQAWAQNVQPESRFIWQMKPEYNVLDPV